MKKENKIMKVYAATTQPGYKVVPQIRLQGEWLRELGFESGDEIIVKCHKNNITIMPIAGVKRRQ